MESSERPPAAETPNPAENRTSPETERFDPHMEGLQGRMLLFDHDIYALSPDEDIEYDIEAGQLGSHETRSHAVFDYASTGERVDYWQDRDTGEKTHYESWRDDVVRIIGNNSDKAQELAVLNEQLSTDAAAVDFENFDEAAARVVYDRYFKSSRKERVQINGSDVLVPSNVRQFVTDALATFTDDTGNLDYDALQNHLTSLQWFARIFGENSAEVVTQLVDAEAKVKTDPTPLLNEANNVTDGTRRVNKPRLKEREEELVTFLDYQLARTKVVAEEDEEIPDTDEYTWHYHRAEKQDKNFPYLEYARSLLSPMNVATELQRKFPQEYGDKNLRDLAREVQADQKAVHEAYDPAHVDEIMRTSLEDYSSFLHRQYGVNEFYKFNTLDVQLLGKMAGKLHNRALGFMFAGAPSIFLNMPEMEAIARRADVNLQEDKQAGIRQILNEVIPHEYTHIIGEQAHWYLVEKDDDNEYTMDDLREARHVRFGRMGSLLGKVIGEPGTYGVPDKGVERGRGIMEAITVELTERWARNTELDLSKDVDAYRTEREVLHKLMWRLVQEGEFSNADEAFQTFVDAYFKQHGMLHLARAVDGSQTTSEGRRERKRPYLLQTIYATMEHEGNAGDGSPYKLTKAIIAGDTLNADQKSQLRDVINASMQFEPEIQLSPAAVKHLIEKYSLGLSVPESTTSSSTEEQEAEQDSTQDEVRDEQPAQEDQPAREDQSDREETPVQDDVPEQDVSEEESKTTEPNDQSEGTREYSSLEERMQAEISEHMRKQRELSEKLMSKEIDFEEYQRQQQQLSQEMEEVRRGWNEATSRNYQEGRFSKDRFQRIVGDTFRRYESMLQENGRFDGVALDRELDRLRSRVPERYRTWFQEQLDRLQRPDR